MLSPSQIVGEAQGKTTDLLSHLTDGITGSKNKSLAPVVKKKGALFEWLENSQKEKMDYEMKKNEKAEEIHRQRILKKMQLEQEQREKQQNY